MNEGMAGEWAVAGARSLMELCVYGVNMLCLAFVWCDSSRVVSCRVQKSTVQYRVSRLLIKYELHIIHTYILYSEEIYVYKKQTNLTYAKNESQ